MDKKEIAAIAAIAGAITTALTALLASLAGLGEHAAGVVAGLLIASPILAFDIILVRQVEQFREQARERESGYAETVKDAALAMQSMASALAKLSDNMSLQVVLTKWREEAAATALVDSTAAIAKALAEHTAAAAKDVADKQEARDNANANTER